jgi:nitric oxide reductase activation protein
VTWASLLASLALVVLLPVVSNGGQQSQAPQPAAKASPAPASNKASGNNNQANKDQETKKQDPEAANAERKKEISAESAKLLKLATELKAEVDKTNKDTLSIGVIRKADEIEKLAHSVKEKVQVKGGGAS